ncbi:SCO family protein [Flexithrix dorotheae]|uniref:SCO family protein n=1 Tax=Flexithrix dorotheae TaxID=70993 RepID=UPI000382BF83|nr:SCO family protein [Flexithrix dorotheae]
MKFFVPFVAILFLILSCGQKRDTVEKLPFYNTPDFTPRWEGEGNLDLKNIHSISEFSLINQDNQQIDNSTLKGKIYVADFFFTTCSGICPKMSENMKLIQNEFLDDEQVLLLSHSVTPEYDTVEILKNYAQTKGVRSGKWHLLTGDKKAIYKLARNSYFVDKELGFSKTVNDFLHTENFVLVDGQGRIRGVYNGTLLLEVKNLIQDIKVLKKEQVN